MSVFTRGTRPSSWLRKGLGLVVAAAMIGAASGCGGGGVSAGASVTAYVVAPLCAEAEKQLARDGGKAGDLRVRIVCLPNPRGSSKLDLARIGANARRATEDSTAVAFIAPVDPQATRFADPILKTANLPSLDTRSGKAAMADLLAAIEAADSDSLRSSVTEDLE